jgi:hypothetical protein
VTDFASVPDNNIRGQALGLAAALRMGLINAAREKVLAANQETMKDHVYRYNKNANIKRQNAKLRNAFPLRQGYGGTGRRLFKQIPHPQGDSG